jgi:hypothetical protein
VAINQKGDTDQSKAECRAKFSGKYPLGVRRCRHGDRIYLSA